MILPTVLSENNERLAAPELVDSVHSTSEQSRTACHDNGDLEPVSLDDPPLSIERRASAGGGLLDSVLCILENVSALCDDNVQESLYDTALTFHPWWCDEKMNHQDISFNLSQKERGWPASCSPINENASLMVDLAKILEPRPLPPSFRSRVKHSSCPGHTGFMSSSSNECQDHQSPPFQYETTQKTTMSSPVPLSCSSSSPSRSPSSRSSASASSTKRKSDIFSIDMRLPESFVPGPYTIVIGRGREARQAPGNHRLRSLATTYIDDYTSASSTEKSRKSQIVANICRAIRSVCPIGAFVRFGQDERWYEVPDSVAMEKVGYTLRELVGERYRSSSKAKRVARQESFATWSSASLQGTYSNHGHKE